ncbi:MAG: amidohydrolase family protein [Bacteroidetes Order II. Incertae sedis bacterium]|jgi:imidazolonepropionase-like amidohydrolase|nr:amidohydrolase family protein [Bacteroidetes Order II. bacterium]MBT4051478.1 amidohydrolase family protein [Bacteroidetes Order II. bacterium]MBT5248623.1 amidohydrolase family protein [Bacteroidetes Order II. bacterium]MBT6200402.1 amidohydrolase family protein [Bacteroidetes Order II. bacterium]MBT6425241.1 amidohydrolase family protein [Bacteroidetes Order II. bacterium]
MLRLVYLLALLLITTPVLAQDYSDFKEGSDGEGPFDRLIIRGATMIEGSGAPPVGPVDIVIENDRIVEIRGVGNPGLPIDPNRRPAAGTREIDAHGMYVLPGFVDMHGHPHTIDSGQGVPLEYVLKLWLAHGITTSRVVGAKGVDWILELQKRSEENTITAPRIYAYPTFGQGFGRPIVTPEDAREWVQWVKEKGADGVKLFGAAPEIMTATLDEVTKVGLRATEHHAQLDVTRMNVLKTASLGLTSMEHWYGLPEALFEDKVIQRYPLDYNYANEADRFGEAGRLWKQAAEPFSPHWNAVMDSLLAMDFTIDPTFIAYLASRDLMRQSRNDWHAIYTMPALWDFYRPSRNAHGSYWFYWTTENEMDWKENFNLWFTFINEYKNRGGRVTLGSDSGYIYNLYGFGYIQEMENMREAGFHPLEVIRSATIMGAEGLGADSEIGTIQVGKKADLVIVPENPLENLKVLYGTGWIRLNDETREVERVGGVKYTIKNGVIFDARALLQDVRDMVEAQKAERGMPAGPMPMTIETVDELTPAGPKK